MIGNVVTGNDANIFIGAAGGSNVIVHNTLHANDSDGLATRLRAA